MAASSKSYGRILLEVLFVALALSIGWGVRGNWGHEYGAMIPGALAAMAAVLVSQRDDWLRRIPFFAFFGAVGWSFGGSISYMQVIGYTHSGYADSVAYGFACLFVIGFLWGALGGVGTALPAFLDRDRLTALLAPTAVVFLAWAVQEPIMRSYFGHLRELVEAGSMTREEFREQIAWLNWYDTDWLGVTVALAAVLLYAAVKRKLDWGTSLILAMCVGWWLGFGLLTVTLGLRMTPPRGDNWSGVLGTTVAVFAFLAYKREAGIAWTAVITGLFGGLGFSGATLWKLILISPTVQENVFGGPTSSNWHSILEQTFGFIAGLGVALALAVLAPLAPAREEKPLVRRWAEPLCVFFVLLVITYVNIVKNLEAVWLKAPSNTVPEVMWGLASQTWFDIAYVALAVTIALPLLANYCGREIAVIPASRMGKGQLLFIVFLWWIVLGNLARTVPFAPQRLITEGVIHIHACLCTLFALLLPDKEKITAPEVPIDFGRMLRVAIVASLVITALAIGGEYATVRALWGDQNAEHGGKHIRFGPDATTQRKERS